MTAIRILHGLEDISATGHEADSVARLGFLEWVFTSPGSVTPAEARRALSDIAPHAPGSAAACAFVSFLQEASRMSMAPPSRRGRAARRLH